jgi:hypothetical protein
MPVTRLYGVFALLAIFAAVSGYILHRRWITRVANSTTPVADTLYVLLLGVVGAPMSVLLSGGTGSFAIASFLTAALLFAVAYGRAYRRGDKVVKGEIAKRFASSMVLTLLILLVLATATGWQL